MKQIYLVLKEHFRINCYPSELADVIITYYLETCNFEIFIDGYENSSMIRTPFNDIYYWNAFGDYRKIELPNVKKLIHGNRRVFAITDNNDLYSWGNNEYGQLGLDIPVGYCIYDDEVKQATKIELSNVKDVVCGNKHVIAVTIDGDIYLWGTDDKIIKPCQIQFSKVKRVFCDYKYVIIITESDEVYNLYPIVKIELPDEIKIKDIIFRHDYVVAVAFSGELYTWTNNIYIPRKIQQSNVNKIIHNKSYNKMAVITDNDVYSWEPYSNKLTKMEILNIKEVVQGLGHFMTLSYNIYSWGDNNCGQLGVGTWDDCRDPQKIDLPNVRKIICNNYSSFAITYKNELYSWGNNDYGRLGLGHKNNVNTPQKIQIENVKDIYCRNDCLIIVTWFGDIYYCGKWYERTSLTPEKLIECFEKMNSYLHFQNLPNGT